MLLTSDGLHEGPVAAGDQDRVRVLHDLHDVAGLADALRPHHAHLDAGEVQDGGAVLVELLPRPSLRRRRVEDHRDVVEGAREGLLRAAELGRPLAVLGHERRLEPLLVGHLEAVNAGDGEEHGLLPVRAHRRYYLGHAWTR